MAKVKTNQFVLLGRVGWKDEIKFFENGTCKQVIQLGVKRGQDKYNNFFISFFNTPTKQTAEEVCNIVKVGDYIQVTGKIVENVFVPAGMEGQKDDKGNQKTVSQTNLVGTSYKFVKWNDEDEEFEFVGGE